MGFSAVTVTAGPKASRMLEGILSDLKARIDTQTVHDDITLVIRHK